jgi:hypothetical protein
VILGLGWFKAAHETVTYTSGEEFFYPVPTEHQQKITTFSRFLEEA